MIPVLTTDGLLPPGIHVATRDQLRARFGSEFVRAQFFAGVMRAADALAHAGCQRLWVDGSFVTNKVVPGDWDGCWDPAGVDPDLLDPTLYDFTAEGRSRMKSKYLADLFPSSFIEQRSTSTFLEYFQIDKTTGLAKGLIQLNLRSSL